MSVDIVDTSGKKNEKVIILLILLFCWTSSGVSDEITIPKEVLDYSKVKYWKYSLSFDVVILMPEDFIALRNYYWDKDKHEDRDTIVAFTAWHKVNGELRPIMFVQARINLAPKSIDLGHQMKHIINWEHRRNHGIDRFQLPCSDWE